MKKIILLGIVLSLTFVAFAQDQTVNGNLTVSGEFTVEKQINIGCHISSKDGLGTRLDFKGVNGNTDEIWMAKYSRGSDLSDLRINIGDNSQGDDRLIIGITAPGGIWKDLISILNNARIGIGVPFPTVALDVNGTIRSKEVKIEATGWSDFVFAEDYKLSALSEVEQHIKEHKHLPDIPSEKEVLEEGISVGEMQAKLLQKIEELTLYTIQLEKRIKELEQSNK